LAKLPSSLAAAPRVRAGRPWRKSSSLEGLIDPLTPCDERLVAAWEHAIINNQPLPVHPRQWVATQRRMLSAAAAPLR
jgi:hypothetical protein